MLTVRNWNKFLENEKTFLFSEYLFTKMEAIIF
jgi:hypothetical protein